MPQIKVYHAGQEIHACDNGTVEHGSDGSFTVNGDDGSRASFCGQGLAVHSHDDDPDDDEDEDEDDGSGMDAAAKKGKKNKKGKNGNPAGPLNPLQNDSRGRGRFLACLNRASNEWLATQSRGGVAASMQTETEFMVATMEGDGFAVSESAMEKYLRGELHASNLAFKTVSTARTPANDQEPDRDGAPKHELRSVATNTLRSAVAAARAEFAEFQKSDPAGILSEREYVLQALFDKHIEATDVELRAIAPDLG